MAFLPTDPLRTGTAHYDVLAPDEDPARGEELLRFFDAAEAARFLDELLRDPLTRDLLRRSLERAAPLGPRLPAEGFGDFRAARARLARLLASGELRLVRLAAPVRRKRSFWSEPEAAAWRRPPRRGAFHGGGLPRPPEAAAAPAVVERPSDFTLTVHPGTGRRIFRPLEPEGPGWRWGTPDAAASIFVASTLGTGFVLEEVEVSVLHRGREYHTERHAAKADAWRIFVHHPWRWDGRDQQGVLDSRVLREPLTLRVRVRHGGRQVAEVQVPLSVRVYSPEWLDVRLDHAQRRAEVYIGLQLQNGGVLRHGIEAGKLQWAEVIQHMPPMPEADFRHLQRLVQQGVARYWSRAEPATVSGKRLVTLGAEEWAVRVHAELRQERAIEADLYWVEPAEFMRSSNSTFWDASLYYLKGYYQENFGDGEWNSVARTAAGHDFMETTAHELGHSILWEMGGRELSWGHKGTAEYRLRPGFQQVLPGTSGYPPAPREIDLMKYYQDQFRPSDFYARVAAAESDVAALLALLSLYIEVAP